MTTWDRFERESPTAATLAARLWPGIVAIARGEPPPRDRPCFEVAYLATVRPDGGPRLHPFCPILATGRLFAAIPSPSPKGEDLRRDPRCVIHARPGPDDAELCIRAQAREVGDETTRAAVAEVVVRSGVGGMVETVTRDPLFTFDVERVDTTYWVNVGQPGTYAERTRWFAS